MSILRDLLSKGVEWLFTTVSHELNKPPPSVEPDTGKFRRLKKRPLADSRKDGKS